MRWTERILCALFGGGASALVVSGAMYFARDGEVNYSFVLLAGILGAALGLLIGRQVVDALDLFAWWT